MANLFGYRRGTLPQREDTGHSDVEGDTSTYRFSPKVAAAEAANGKLPTTQLVRALVQGTWFGTNGNATRDGVLNQWANIALICGLSAGFAVAGLFVDVSQTTMDRFPYTYRAYLVVWCFATLGMMSATLGYVCLIIGITELDSKSDFEEWKLNIGWFVRIPLWVALASAASLYLGIVLFFFLKCGTLLTTYCAISCCLACFVPMVVCCVVMVRALLVVRQGHHHRGSTYKCDADTIYDALRKYYWEECQSDLSKMSRESFCHQFRSVGEVAEKLTFKIYDDWLDKKLTSMLREDPGF